MKKVIVFIVIALFQVFSFASADSNNVVDHSSSYKYFEKMNQFGRLTDYQFKAFLDHVQGQYNLDSSTRLQLEESIQMQRNTLWSEIQKMENLYNKIFIEKTATKEDRKALVYSESNLSIAIHRQLIHLHDFLKSNKPGSYRLSQKTTKLIEKLNTISNELREGKSIAVPASMGISQVFQAGQKLPTSICKLAAGFCTRASLSELMDSLDERNFLRDGQKYQYKGISNIKAELDKNKKAVFILIGNHDQPLMDIALARNVSLQLGSDQHITMTRKSVYPIPPPEKAGDVVFVVDNDPKSNPVQKSLDLLTENIVSKNKDRVSLAVYPEGMLPYTGGQMPMTVKEGAFVIARKLAVQLEASGVPVFLVQMKSNIIEHLSATNAIAPEVKMEFIERVPSNPIDKSQPDVWIETKRLQAENSFNSHRGNTQIDVFNLDKVPHSKIPYGLEMRSCSKVFIP